MLTFHALSRTEDLSTLAKFDTTFYLQ